MRILLILIHVKLRQQDVTDPTTGDTSTLILDVHKYLDSDGSGTHTECTTK
jgi:hypothetical protein